MDVFFPKTPMPPMTLRVACARLSQGETGSEPIQGVCVVSGVVHAVRGLDRPLFHVDATM